MQVYKILHKPTGLFYTPSKGYGNLSTTGKIYARKPNLNQIGGSVRIIVREYGTEEVKLSKKLQTIVDFFKIQKETWGAQNHVSGYHFDKHINVPNEDWEIIEL
jgi:hypothetical protein